MISWIDLFAEMRYCPLTGVWRRAPSRRNPQGRLAGCIKRGRRPVVDDYIYVSVQHRNYLSHRLAWKYMTGGWPPGQLDHRDTDKKNNRWLNLRLANNSQQKHNAPVRLDNRTGKRGVRLEPTGKFGARIFHSGKSHWLGTFDTSSEAEAVYIAEAKKFFGEFAPC